MIAQLLFLHALSPLHVGTGRGVGVIDLPIARERATSLPIVPGSSLKGVLRAETASGERNEIFGDVDNAGQVQVSDLRLLLLPVRSLRGTFAWVTSPFVLRRFVRDVQDVGGKVKAEVPPAPQLTEREAQCFVAKDSALFVGQEQQKMAVLEDLDLQAAPRELVEDWTEWLARALFPGDSVWRDELRQRLCIVPDDVMSFFAQNATEVSARIRLKKDSKTVESGGLWYEESLPAESVLSGIVLAQPRGGQDATKLLKMVRSMADKPLQLGGNATVGRGLCRLRLAEV